jgi:hypothetical protein
MAKIDKKKAQDEFDYNWDDDLEKSLSMKIN